MSKIIKQYAAVGVVPGARVEGLVAQSLLTVYAPNDEGPEEIVSITELPEYEDMVVIRTKELNAKTTVLTSKGEMPLTDAQKQYVMSGTEALRVVSRVDMEKLKGIEIEGKKKLTMSVSDDGIDTEYSTLPTAFVKSLAPFLNYVSANETELNDIMDISSLTFTADGVAYDMPTLTALSKIE